MTLKIRNRTKKMVLSDINKTKAYLDQVKKDSIYTDEDREKLIPIYAQQLAGFEEELKHL